MVKQKKLMKLREGTKTITVTSSTIRMRKFAQRTRRLSAQALRIMSQKHTEAAAGGGDDDSAVTLNSVSSNTEDSKEFLSTGRTGRRNAMPDILGKHANTGLSDLPTQFEALTAPSQPTVDQSNDMDQAKASTSQQMD